jgi:hypothetical protein
MNTIDISLPEDSSFPSSSSDNNSPANSLIHYWEIPENHKLYISNYFILKWDKHTFERKSWKGFIVRDGIIYQCIPHVRSALQNTAEAYLLSFRRHVDMLTGYVLYKPSYLENHNLILPSSETQS